MTVGAVIGIILGLIGAIASVWFLVERVFPRRRLSWGFVQRAVTRMASKMAADGFSPTVIIGIGRGGAVTGALISGALGHRPLIVIDRKYVWEDGRRHDDMLLNVQFPESLLQMVLLVSGEVHTGNTMRLYCQHFCKIGAKRIARAAVFLQSGSTEPVEYIGFESARDVRLPWMSSEKYVRDSRSEEEARGLQLLSSHLRRAAGTMKRSCFLIRHGESTDNADEDRFSGITDSQLTGRGLSQAEAVARALREENVERVYASPMKRAVATARAIQSKAAGVLLVDQRLREMDYGEWEGLSRKEVRYKWDELYDQWLQDPVSNMPPGSEPPAEVLERILSFWRELLCDLRTHDVRSVAIVTHKTVLRLLLGHMAQEPAMDYRGRFVANGSITKVVVNEDGSATVEAENLVEHLAQTS